MKSLFFGFFHDATGQPSMMRLLTCLVVVVCLLLLAALGVVVVVVQKNPDGLLPVCEGLALLIGLAFGAKATQSFAEVKTEVAGLFKKSPQAPLDKGNASGEGISCDEATNNA